MNTKTAIILVAAGTGVLVLLAVSAVATLLFLRGFRHPEVPPPVQPSVDSHVRRRSHDVQPSADNQGGWTSHEVATPDSVEGQLRSQGKRWVPTNGEIAVGAYVQDILEGRLGQPKGRGAIGKVVSISTWNNGVEVAIVDFGAGFTPPISLSELSLVEVVPE